MTKGLEKANDHEVFVSHEDMDVWDYGIERLCGGGVKIEVKELRN